MRYQLQNKVKIVWTSDFAYAIGLITSDGCLSKDNRHILFTSKDLELVTKFKQALRLTNTIYRTGRGNELGKNYFSINFSDKVFHQFLNTIGLTAAKSKTIRSVQVPDKLFADFSRGVFDGDGSFYAYWDKRWQNSFAYKMSFASASLSFVSWIKERLSNLYGVKGYFHKGKGVTNLEYTKDDSKKLFEKMYYANNLLFLNRKYTKVKTALELDNKLRCSIKKISRKEAAVAHW